MTKIIKRLTTIFTIVFMCFVLFVLVFGVISLKKDKYVKIFGYSYSVVGSPSMHREDEESIDVYDMIIVKEIPYDEVELLDIIYFFNPKENKFIIHRVVEITEEGFVTKGDNNSSKDEMIVTEELFHGILVKRIKNDSFLGIGKIITNSRSIMFIFVFGIFIIMIILETINIFKIADERQKLKLDEEKAKNRELEKAKLKEELLKELEESQKIQQ